MQLIGDVDALKASLAQTEPPAGLDPALTALWWSAKTQFDTAELGKDLYKAMGQPFNGGGSLAMLTTEAPDYGAPPLSPRWCWGVAPRVNRGRPTRWCSPRSCSAGASRSIRVLRPGHRHVQPPGGMSWRARRSGTEPRASRVLGRRSILWWKGDQPWAPPAPNCAHEARCAPSAARGEPARQSFVRPNQRIGEAAPTCAHLRPGGALRTSSYRNVSRRGVTLPRENAADRGRWSSSSQPRIAAAASSKI